MRRLIGDILIAEQHYAGTGREHPSDDIDKRGFAGPVRPDDRPKAFRLELCSDIVYGKHAAKMFVKALCAQNRGHGS